jgi:hypothetical protein
MSNPICPLSSVFSPLNHDKRIKDQALFQENSRGSRSGRIAHWGYNKRSGISEVEAKKVRLFVIRYWLLAYGPKTACY